MCFKVSVVYLDELLIYLEVVVCDIEDGVELFMVVYVVGFNCVGFGLSVCVIVSFGFVVVVYVLCVIVV